MNILLSFGIDGDLISVPKKINNEIYTYANRFGEWILDKENDHGYWLIENGEKKVCCYRGLAFVEWLNTNILINSSEKASVIETNVRIEDYKSLLMINF